MRPVKRAIPAPLIGLLAAGSAFGQLQTSYDAEMQAELIGVLTHTRLSVEFDGVPAREAFRSVSAALATPIFGRYSDDRFGHGIDPEVPVTFKAEDAGARLVLEMILEQCAAYEPCIWQLRKGYIEVGTKERLGFPAAAEARLYNVRDLMLEPPYFVSPGSAGRLIVGGGFGAGSIGDCSSLVFDNHPYSCAALTKPATLRPATGRGLEARSLPQELIHEIAEGIVETIEPGNWDYGQNNDEDDPESELARNGRIQGPWQVDAVTRLDKIARIRIWRDTLVISAPDYIHRQIDGYPRPIPPRPLTEAQRLDRSRKASVNGARVVVRGTAADRGGRR
jgi:hypothetical protein